MIPDNLNQSRPRNTSAAGNLSCAEFQETLPDLFASGGSGLSDDPALVGHLTTCANCSALVRDLQYIADQARMLLEPAEEEPSPSVWSNIQNKLNEGIDDERSGTRHPV